MSEFMYQSEKFRVARQVLMAPHPNGEDDSFTGALHECQLGLKDVVETKLDDDARRDVEIIRHALDTTGVEMEEHEDGSLTAKIRQMNDEQKSEISGAVDRLATWFDHRFWGVS